MAGNILEALESYLSGHPALADLTGVYFNAPPVGRPGGGFPYLVFGPLQAVSDLNTTDGYLDYPEFQFNLLGTDDVQVYLLGTKAYRALLPMKDNPPLLFDDGAEVVRMPVWHDRMTLQPGRSIDNKPVWAYQFQYQFIVGRLMVAPTSEG